MIDYSQIDENELASLLSDGDEEVKDIIFSKYNYIIDIIIKKYSRVIHTFQLDESEVRQEASYGFSDGITSYCEYKNSSLRTFLTLCIERRVTKYLTKYTNNKALIIKETLSLDENIFSDGIALADTISDQNHKNPLEDLTSSETINEILTEAKKCLSDFELQVFELMVNGVNYVKISEMLNKTPKQIDNTIQRVKLKLRKELKNIN